MNDFDTYTLYEEGLSYTAGEFADRRLPEIVLPPSTE